MSMQAYCVRFQVVGWRNYMDILVDAKSKESAINKIKRQYAKRYHKTEDDVEIISVKIVGYF